MTHVSFMLSLRINASGTQLSAYLNQKTSISCVFWNFTKKKCEELFAGRETCDCQEGLGETKQF